jgi:hypothetical protein
MKRNLKKYVRRSLIGAVLVVIVVASARTIYEGLRARMKTSGHLAYLTDVRVIAIDNNGRAIYYTPGDDMLHGHFEKGFLGFGWKIVPSDRQLTNVELAKVKGIEAKYAAKEARRIKKRLEEAEKKLAKSKALRAYRHMGEIEAKERNQS